MPQDVFYSSVTKKLFLRLPDGLEQADLEVCVCQRGTCSLVLVLCTSRFTLCMPPPGNMSCSG